MNFFRDTTHAISGTFILPIVNDFGQVIQYVLVHPDGYLIGKLLGYTVVDSSGIRIGDLENGMFFPDKNYINDCFPEDDHEDDHEDNVLTDEDFTNMEELDKMIDTAALEAAALEAAALEAAALEAAALEAAALEAAAAKVTVPGPVLMKEKPVTLSELEDAFNILEKKLFSEKKPIVSFHHILVDDNKDKRFTYTTGYHSGLFTSSDPILASYCVRFKAIAKKHGYCFKKDEFAELLYLVKFSNKNPHVFFKKEMRPVVPLNAVVPNQQETRVVLVVV